MRAIQLKLEGIRHLDALYVRLKEHFQSYGQPLRVDVGEWRRRRSIPQNSALWGVAYKTLYQATGILPEHWHHYFCGEFFGWREQRIGERYMTVPLRTTTTNDWGEPDTISTRLMADLYEFIQARAAMGEPPVDIPDPDPKWKERMREASFI